jgi:hypothetical protein
VRVPRYFFHIRDRELLISDEEGIELPDAEAARNEAERAVVDSLKDALLTGDDILHQVVEVTDADGSMLFSVEFRKVLWTKDGP